ncbi:hypothetical protein SAMN05216359_12125 [Roseateles sp. YR242]|uniref:hypothetical protein n=1 Tax=Roseateles sp. YR242 TaxID=1855305 RepID=UPI0008AA914D|nr:hypothetical protein [Roseateles sp. YR242]SEL87675.1 hypothetical protein SAMN05216359_12125 [Roseateles sp. YR242]
MRTWLRALATSLCLVATGVGAALAPALPATPPEHQRTPDQTFLTFPEWYLVHSPAEYAAYLGTGAPASRFPLFSHIGQFWQSYGAINGQIQAWPFNGGYHLMVMVIGVSTTVEYALKGVYERTIGRLAEGLRSGAPVEEERFAARYAQSYVDFIRVDPWYQFDFASQLKMLWRDVPMAGPDLLRKWERRYLLTTELLVKAGYARMIKLGTQTLYDPPKPVTAVVLSRNPAPGPACSLGDVDGSDHPDYRPLGPIVAKGPQLATIPRYEGFTTYAVWLAAQDIDFLSVAGNQGEIVISELVSPAWALQQGRLLFEQPILTRPGQRRVVIAVPIAQLGQELRRAAHARDTVEHVYDF